MTKSNNIISSGNLGHLLFVVTEDWYFCSHRLQLAVAAQKAGYDVAVCAAKDSDAIRLICYDEIAKSLGVDKPVTKITKGKGKWRIREDTSAIDDSVNVYLSLAANETVKSGYNSVIPELHIRCAENKTNVFVTWGLYLGLDETKMLTRFDKEKATTTTWSISTNNKSVFVRSGDINYAKTLMKHEKLLLQITPYNENPVVATLDIGGLEEAIKPLRGACQW